MTIHTFDIKKFWITLLSILIIISASSFYMKSKENENNKKNINALNGTIKTYSLKNGQLVLSVENLNYSNLQLKKTVLDKDKKLKELVDKFSKVRSVTTYVTNTKIDTISVIYKDSVPCVFNRTGLIKENEYSLSYNSNQKGIKIDNLKILDSVTIVIGTKRKWFLGKQTETFDITHSNKYINTVEAQHIEVSEPKKWYESTLFKFGIGVVSGYFIKK